MDFNLGKSIEIEDKPLFDSYFHEFPPEISEMTFTNLFIWKDYYKYSFLEWNEHLLVFSEDYLKIHKKSLSKNPETLFFLPPVGPDPVQVIFDIFEVKKNIEIHRVPESLVKKLEENEKFQSSNIKWIDDRDNWDYVYEKEKLISLSGGNLFKKRRWLRKFLESYDSEFYLFSKERLEDCRLLQIEWCDLNECKKHPDLEEEHLAISYAIDYYSDLKFDGGVLYVEGKAIAYTFGEKLNDNTMVIHIEKALIEYQGSYQAINNLFCKNCCQDLKYVNREQDLGDPGLRQAKSSYEPHDMVKKVILYK